MILDNENGLFLDPIYFGYEDELSLEPVPADPEVVEKMLETITNVKLFMIVLTSSSLVGRMVLSKAL